MFSFPNFEPAYCSMSGSNCLLDLYVGKVTSYGRLGGLVLPSLEEFSTVFFVFVFVFCDPHNQML